MKFTPTPHNALLFHNCSLGGILNCSLILDVCFPPATHARTHGRTHRPIYLFILQNWACNFFPVQKRFLKHRKMWVFIAHTTIDFLIIFTNIVNSGSLSFLYVLWGNICCFLLQEITSICHSSLWLGSFASILAHLRIY